MAILQMQPELAAKLKDFIHANYGRASGLLRDDYNIMFDVDSQHDVEMHSGAVVNIILKFPPGHYKFEICLKQAFSFQHIKQLLRSKALVKRADFERWHGVSFSNMEATIPKRPSVRDVRTHYVTQLHMQDTRTKRSVIVEVENGNAFDANDKATKLLFGERL
jgi:hypothetical protein